MGPTWAHMGPGYMGPGPHGPGPGPGPFLMGGKPQKKCGNAPPAAPAQLRHSARGTKWFEIIGTRQNRENPISVNTVLGNMGAILGYSGGAVDFAN